MCKVVVVTDTVTAGGHVVLSTKCNGHEPVTCAFALAFGFTFGIATLAFLQVLNLLLGGFELPLEFGKLVDRRSTVLYPERAVFVELDMPPGTQWSTCPRCAAVSISPSVTSSTSWSVEGIMKEKGTDESLSSPKVRRLGS